MNFKKSALASAITLATFATGAAAFDASSWEVSGFVKNETAALQGSGTFIGQATSTTDTASKNDGGDVIKFENTAKVFVNGDLTENAALHAELNFVYDTEATPNDYQDHMNYSQNDYLRELYVDSAFGENGDVELRLGKQQVVWGTADGMKLLDIINPTDYREFAQNTMEDSRIPVWMANLNMPVGENGSAQVVLSQARRNIIAGIEDADGESRSINFTWATSTTDATTALKGVDAGNPYLMKGVDTIIGQVNGFLNIGAAMGAVTSQFSGNGKAYVTDGAGSSGNGGYSFINPYYDADGTTDTNGNSFAPEYNTVGTFTASNAMPNECGSSQAGGGDACLKFMTEKANAYVTNLTDADPTTGNGWDTSNPNSMWEYMSNATFATFNAFVGMTTKYERLNPDDENLNLGGRYRTSFDSGLNLSLNYLYAYDPNPVVQIHWEDPSSGQELDVETVSYTASGASRKTIQLKNPVTSKYYGVATNFTDSYGMTDVVASSNLADDPAQLVFEETLNRIHNIGTAMDYTLETDLAPVVLRGEFLYQKDVMTPVINRTKLGYGDLTGALKMEKGDYFKYVIGADVTVLTNMLVSAQFIQERNLDYVDEGASLSDTTWRYTADRGVMHLTNGLQKAEENKEFYSLFLSKPFGANQLGRWNNIFIFEEGGGKWNRFDVEYSFSDELIGSFELNNYWGDANTQFGQMEDSSNIQVGLKYLF
jgi:hypothetical protein